MKADMPLNKETKSFLICILNFRLQILGKKSFVYNTTDFLELTAAKSHLDFAFLPLLISLYQKEYLYSLH